MVKSITLDDRYWILDVSRKYGVKSSASQMITVMKNTDYTDDMGKAVSSGIYFYRLEAGDFTGMRKMVVMR